MSTLVQRISADAELKSSFPFPVFVLAGGFIEKGHRARVRAGGRPSSDVLELEKVPGARLLDHHCVEDHKAEEPLTRFIAQRLGLSWALAFRTLRHMQGPAAIYATGEDLGIPLGLFARLLRKKNVFLATRLEDPYVGRTPIRKWLFRRMLGGALARLDLVFCRSRRHMKYLKETFGYGNTVLGREVNDVTFYDPSRARAGDTREDEFEMPRGPFVLSAGLEMRDYQTLVEAVRDLPIQVVIGAASPWSHSQFCPEGGLPSNVTVSKFNPVQMRLLYSGAEMVVVPLRPTWRTCGISVVLEGFAMRKAVVVTRTGGLGDYVKDGDNVVEVNPGDASDLREKIQKLLVDKELRAKLAQSGHERVKKELTLLEYPRIVVREVLTRAGGRLGAFDHGA